MSFDLDDFRPLPIEDRRRMKVTVSHAGIKPCADAWRALGCPRHVRLMVDTEERHLAIVPCTVDCQDALEVKGDVEAGHGAVCRYAAIRAVYGFTGIDEPTTVSFRLPVTFDKDHRALFVDMKKPFDVRKRKEKD